MQVAAALLRSVASTLAGASIDFIVQLADTISQKAPKEQARSLCSAYSQILLHS